MDIEGKRKLAIDILEDEMSEYTSEYLDGVDYLKDWIIEAMFRFNKEVNNVVLDDDVKCEHLNRTYNEVTGRFICSDCGIRIKY